MSWKVHAPRLRSPSATSARTRRPQPAPVKGRRRDTSIEIAPESTRTKPPPNPLWVIAIGMAVFFAFTALIMMV
jgi:hypothetical protein